MFHDSLPPNKDLQPSSASNCEGEYPLSMCFLESSHLPLTIVYYTDDPQIPELIKEKIGYVFGNLHSNNFPGLVLQFWAPLKISGRRLLTTSDQPFLLHDSEIYRSLCVKYMYNIDVNKVEDEDEEEPTNTIISSGSVATAFLNQLPELVGNQRVDGMSPLETCALECGFVCSFVLPVFYPSQSCCVGVIEYASSCYNHLHKFNLLNSVLQKVGLKTFDAQEHLPCKTICGLQNVKDEIDEALKIIWARNRFISAQVWIACEDENHVAFTSFFQGNSNETNDRTQIDRLQQTWLEAYGNACYNLPLKMDEGLAGRTLQNYEPHFIDNIDILSANAPQRLFSCVFKHACLVIYLRSTKTGDLDYVFEILWGHERQHSAFLFESLLLELMERLPSFKFASGAEVGDELRILNVKNSTKSELEYFKIFTTESVTPKRERRQRLEVEECLRPLKGKCKTTPIPLSQEDIQPHFGKTMI
ncbi:hypothetical protein OSB04_010455 [Centaurea solstitialis]|uniref:NLP1-9 GAF domain-containing protein n=1 Tax=Centaurea solstitialis TaxID=347529 RepID=A0AA38TKT2_9ASTR|nr:hypothetical protein OSB04_010455 [Centaurea solstitialis]